MERPKRPLTSFNLFYRYKRAIVLEMAGNEPSKEDVLKILSSIAGLEEGTPLETIDQQPPSSDDINTLRRRRIREALKGKILPMNNKRRRHRKAANSVGISFREMGELMTTCWKGVDSFGKKVFEELSEEGRHIYRVQMDEYNKLNPPKKSTPDNTKVKVVKKDWMEVKKQSKPMAVPTPATLPVTLPAAAAFAAAPLPRGLSILPVQMMIQNGIAAFQRKPPMAPIPTTNRSYLMAVAQYNAIMASKSPPYNRMSETKIEAKSSSGAAFNLNVLATAAAVAAEPKKRDLPLDPKRSVPLKKRFKRP